MLKTLEIKNLFDVFDYKIEFKDGLITILTGPNGYGKTTILKIIDAFASYDMYYFSTLQFTDIKLEMSEVSSISISKTHEKLLVQSGSDLIGKEILFADIQAAIAAATEKGPFDRVDRDHWFDQRTERTYDLQDLIKSGAIVLYTPEKLGYTFPTTYFIREQRLVKRSSLSPTARNRQLYYRRRPGYMDPLSETIEDYAQELSGQIQHVLTQYSQKAQKFDSTFPQRLFDASQEISEEEFNARFGKVKAVQQSLTKFGLSITSVDNHPTYRPENAKPLAVYLSDTEHKLAVFHELVERLDLFTDILNNRRFTFKRVVIDKECGFKFESRAGHPLPLKELSSGEQQEVILLYELLFRANEKSLVLIDEPEISLHVAWQKAFLDDLSHIVDMQCINVIVATHSPQIINEKWELTIDLEEVGTIISHEEAPNHDD